MEMTNYTGSTNLFSNFKNSKWKETDLKRIFKEKELHIENSLQMIKFLSSNEHERKNKKLNDFKNTPQKTRRNNLFRSMKKNEDEAEKKLKMLEIIKTIEKKNNVKYLNVNNSNFSENKKFVLSTLVNKKMSKIMTPDSPISNSNNSSFSEMDKSFNYTYENNNRTVAKLSTKESSNVNTGTDFFLTGANLANSTKNISQSLKNIFNKRNDKNNEEGDSENKSKKILILNSFKNKTNSIDKLNNKITNTLNDHHNNTSPNKLTKQQIRGKYVGLLDFANSHLTLNQNISKKLVHQKTLGKKELLNLNTVSNYNYTEEKAKIFKTVSGSDINKINLPTPIFDLPKNKNYPKNLNSYNKFNIKFDDVDDFTNLKSIQNDIKKIHNEIDKRGFFFEIQTADNRTIKKFFGSSKNNVFSNIEFLSKMNSATSIKHRSYLEQKYDLEFKEDEVLGIKPNIISHSSLKNINTLETSKKLHENFIQAYNKNLYDKVRIFRKYKIVDSLSNKKMK